MRQDTKPHREFKFSQILDALEYDLPPNRQIPSAPQPPSPNPPTSTFSDKDSTRDSHTFKIVTTKRTLLLCAPTEEEEIKWLSAIGALIARRKDQGVVPGESRPGTISSHGGAVDHHLGASSESGGPGTRVKARKLSASGSAAFTGAPEGAS